MVWPIQEFGNEQHWVVCFQITMLEYLVSCVGKKKRISVEKKSDISQKIMEVFQLAPSCEDKLTLQAWDSKWEEYVDVDDVDSLPDSCKLAATVQLASFFLHGKLSGLFVVGDTAIIKVASKDRFIEGGGGTL